MMLGQNIIGHEEVERRRREEEEERRRQEAERRAIEQQEQERLAQEEQQQNEQVGMSSGDVIEDETVLNTQTPYSFNDFHSHTVDEERPVYVDDPEIIDQPTHTGIIQSTLDGFRRNNPEKATSYPTNVRDLNQEQIQQIYQTEYYDRYRIDEINNQRTARAISDMFVMSSPDAVARTVQETLVEMGSQVDVDGIMGSQSINALNNSNLNNDEFMRRLIQNRQRYLDSLPDREQYPGWRNRTNRY